MIKYSLSFILLLISCSKDVKVLIPVQECKIIGNYSSFSKKWRFTNFNHQGDIISYGHEYFTNYLMPDKPKNELSIHYGEKETYSRKGDMIFYTRESNQKPLGKRILKDNLISQLINNEYRFRLEYQYKDDFLFSETAYRLPNNLKWYERKFTYDTVNLYDNNDFKHGTIAEFIHFENRIINSFYELNQKYLRLKEVSYKVYNDSGELSEDQTYQYSYINNERGLVSHKIIKELIQGIYKDTVSNLYLQVLITNSLLSTPSSNQI